MGAFELMNLATGSNIREIFTVSPKPKFFEEMTVVRPPATILIIVNDIIHKFHPVHIQKRFEPTVGVPYF